MPDQANTTALQHARATSVPAARTQSNALARQAMNLATRIAALERQVKANTPSRLMRQTLEGFIPVRDTAGALIGRIGRQPDGGVAVVALSGPTPTATPLGLDMRVVEGGITVTWGGEFYDGQRPSDFLCVEVVRSTDPDAASESSYTIVGEIVSTKGGTASILAPAGKTYYYAARIRTASGAVGPLTSRRALTMPASTGGGGNPPTEAPPKGAAIAHIENGMLNLYCSSDGYRGVAEAEDVAFRQDYGDIHLLVVARWYTGVLDDPYSTNLREREPIAYLPAPNAHMTLDVEWVLPGDRSRAKFSYAWVSSTGKLSPWTDDTIVSDR